MLKNVTLTFRAPHPGGCVPPLDCSCGVINLILHNPTLTVDNSGVLEVNLLGPPTRQAAAVNEGGASFWLWDYDISYEDSLFDDPIRPLRNCDIKLACCDDCSTLFLKGKLRGYVESVTGDGVDNTDPNNPVITQPGAFAETLTTLTTSGTNLIYQDELGNDTTINLCTVTAGCGYGGGGGGGDGGVLSVVDLSAGDVCSEFGSQSSIRQATVFGTELRVQAAPEHKSTVADASRTGTNNSDISAVGTITVPNIQLTVVPQCRSQTMIITVDAGFNLDLPVGWGGNFKLQMSSDGGFTFTDQSVNTLTAYARRVETFDFHSTVIAQRGPNAGLYYIWQLQIQTVIPAAGAVWNNYAYSARAHAVTT